MQKGTVKWFSAQKGFGFIQPDSGADVFVHISAVERAGLRGISEGQTVEFDTSTVRGEQVDRLFVFSSKKAKADETVRRK